jgi:hypothetical protein
MHEVSARQGRRPQARSVKVGLDGNGILVKKNLTSSFGIGRRHARLYEAAGCENTACARGVL